jgi:hypothetical protein
MARRTKAHNPEARTRRKPEPVETRQIANDRIWKTVTALAEGNMTRVEVVSYTHVTVVIP